MGLLNDDYWKGATSTPVQPVVAPQQPVAQAAPVAPAPVATPQPGSDPLLNKNPVADTAMRLGPLGVVGGALGIPFGPVGVATGALVGASVGASIKYPDNWDQLSTIQKIGFVGGQAATGLVRTVMSLPSEIVKTPIRYTASVAQPWVAMATGKDASFKGLGEAPVLDLPLLGKIPTYFQSYDEAKKSGMGPLASALMTGGTALGDALIVGALGEAGTRALQPKAGVRTPIGEAKITNTVPVKAVIQRDATRVTGVARQVEGSVSEYYPVPKATAQQFGGHTNNTFFKLTPASPTSVELSVVKTRGGAIQKGVDWLRGNKTSQGDFGPEVKINSQIIDTGQSVLPQEMTPLEGAKLNLSFIEDAMQGHPGQGLLRYRSSASGELPEINKTGKGKFNQRGDAISQEVMGQDLSGGGDINVANEALQSFIKLRDEAAALKTQIKTLEAEAKTPMTQQPVAPINIPSSVVKGMENKTITNDQLGNLARIGDANGVAPSIRDAVIRSVTKKDVMGEMTQAEYVKAAQTLGMFNGAAKHVPSEAFLNPAAQYLSPQRRWMRTYEERSGIPLYSEAYVPLEDAVRVRDVFREVWRGKSRELFGEYANPSHSAERQAIYNYMQGDKSAVIGNEAFTAAAKGDMIRIADGLRQFYNEIGPQMNVPPEIFLKNYQPHIQNIGGVFQLYKEGSTAPKAIDFFAKYKRKGNPTAPLIDDALALFDIYTNAGSNSTFVTPALERIGAMGENLPSTLKNSLTSYVQEKLGYAGRMEQAMDEMVPAINRNLGINLPPDTARQAGDLILSTQYSGLLSQPATWFRQMFQYPLFGYSRLGPKFAVDAYRKAFTKEGLAEFNASGFSVDLGYPYGGALSNESTLGGRIGTTYKTVTQAPIAPNAFADNSQRAVVYYQYKMQFEESVAKFNEGKIPWSTLEKEIDMSSFSPVDQNIARGRIVAGDVKGAFEHLVRDVIDETQFPYRKASTARVGYGFGGKVATSLLQWPMEASHTLGSWMKQGARTGDFTKLIRYFAASATIQRSLSTSFGMDFSRTLYMGPVLTTSFVAPIPQLAGNLASMIANAPFLGVFGGADNRQTFNDSKDKVVANLRANMPAGLQVRNIQRFWRSVERGPDENGQYAALDDKGQVKYYTDFSGIFTGELMGFPIDKKVRESQLNQQMINATTDLKEVKGRVMEMIQQEKYDEASSLMSEFGIQVTPNDFDNYYIPRTQRTFQLLQGSLKAQFAPRVFPEAFSGVQ